MPPPELFHTDIVSRDPRYPHIIVVCNYSMAGLFLGMFLTLSGVMLTPFNDEDDEPGQSDKHRYSHLFGIILLVSGCSLILFSILSFLVASLMYLKTTTSPPAEESGERVETIWSYLDTLPEKSRSSGNQESSSSQTN